MIVQLLTEHHLEFLSLKGGCRGLSESLHLSKCQIVGNLCGGSYYASSIVFIRIINTVKTCVKRSLDRQIKDLNDTW